jgi:cell pole-organizing protein PopZ
MGRNRNEVLRSIAALLAEVNSVSMALASHHKSPSKEVPSSGGGLIPDRQITLITDSLQRIFSATGQGRDRKTLERLVERTLNAAIQTWMDENLPVIVEEVIDQELSKQKIRRVR